MVRRTTLLALALGCSAARAADISVGPAQDHITIQSAIDAAVSGDRIQVAAGNYFESLYIDGKDLIIEGTGGRENTTVTSPFMLPYGGNLVEIYSQSTVTLTGLTLDAGHERRTVVVGYDSALTLDDMALKDGLNRDGFPGGNLDLYTSSSAVVSNTTFSGGDAEGVFPFGGNIGLEDASTIVFGDGVVVSDGTATRGGGLWVDSGTVADVWRVTFDQNTATGFGDNDGGGICVEAGGSVTVAESTFSNNQAGADGGSAGGGLYSASALTSIYNSTFVANYAYVGGGAAVEDGSADVRDTVFDANSAFKGSGLACASAPVCGLVRSRVYLGDATLGGGLYAWNSFTTVAGSTFCNNTVSDPIGGPVADGGAIRQSEGALVLRNNVFSNNSAAGMGGAVSLADGVLDSRNNHYVDSTAGSQGGAIHVQANVGVGAVLFSVNDLYLRSESSTDGAVSTGPGVVGLPNVTYAWLWQSSPGPGAIGASPTNFNEVGDPQLNAGINNPCDASQMTTGPGSPLIDAGSPAFTDPDGTVSDIGAFGGPLADGITEDVDGDGVIAVLDCDDNDPSITYASAWHPDADGDGFGDASLWVFDCTPPPGYLANGSDCDDYNPAINPLTSWFEDQDQDGYGDPNTGFQACDPGANAVLNPDDCDDGDPTVGPTTFWHYDGDGDGFGIDASFSSCGEPPYGAAQPGDCDDEDKEIHPGATEVCDGVDQDCNQLIDDDAADAELLHPDEDGDGYGAPDAVRACEPEGFVDDGTDCDDTDASVNPGATEVWYDGVDDDCDGHDDDRDGDGFGHQEDCDDEDPKVNPDAVDAYDDGVDADCDGVDARTWLAGGSGCACDTSGSPAAPWGFALLGLLTLVRRRT